MTKKTAQPASGTKVVSLLDRVSGTTIEIKADTKILIEIERPTDEGGTRNALSFGSFVEEVLDDGCLLITMPVHKGAYYPLPRDKPILTYFFIGLRMFSVSVRFLERIVRDKLAYARIRVLNDLQANQRRDCYRLQCLLPVAVERVSKSNPEPAQEAQTAQSYDCEMLNFSDGGILFATDEIFDIGEIINLTFDIGTVEPESITAEVLRVEKPYKGIFKHNIAVKFRHKCQKQKGRFYRYIVVQQRAKLRQQADEGSLNDF